MKKKKRNDDVPSFVDIEAEEDSSLDFELEAESEDIDGVQVSEPELKPRKNWQTFTQDLANKYNVEDEEDSSEPSQMEEVTYTPQYMFMPDNKSPRLWIVRTVRNKEREVAFKVLANILQNEKDKLSRTEDFNYFANDICSVVVKPDLFGYIYIESYSRQAVLDALHSIRLVNRQRVSPVPLCEMVDVLTIKGTTDVAVNSYARIRKGKYRNDVCQILEVISTEMVKIRIVPRLNNASKRFDIGDLDDKQVQIKEIGGKKIYIYKRETFVHGFLEKEMMMSNLVFNTDISFDETKVFESKKKFNLGEKVRIRRGDYTNTQGIIKNIERSEVEVQINTDTIRIDINDVEKFYTEGDTISFKGRNAMIVRIANDIVKFIYTDNFGEEGEARLDYIEPQIFDKGFEIIKNLNMNRIRRDPYLNMQVEIKKGEYKGFIGVVKDVYKDNCRVLVDSNSKYTTIQRCHLELQDDKTSRISVFGSNDKKVTFDTFGKTPMHTQNLGKTPSYTRDVGKTPSYSKDIGKTPSYDRDIGKTPSYANERQNNVHRVCDTNNIPNYKQNIGRTPNYNQNPAKTPNYNQNLGKTPNYYKDAGKTPNYNQNIGKTPNYIKDIGKTPNYNKDAGIASNNNQSIGKTPNYNQLLSKTASLNQNIGRTPNYNHPPGQTPNYKQNTCNTPNYKKDFGESINNREDAFVNKNTHTKQSPVNAHKHNISWLLDKSINNVLVTVGGQERILKEIKNDRYFLDDGKGYERVQYVRPDKYDKVCVMEGTDKGMYGILIEMDNHSGVVKSDNNEVRKVDLNSLTKLNTKYK